MSATVPWWLSPIFVLLGAFIGFAAQYSMRRLDLRRRRLAFRAQLVAVIALLMSEARPVSDAGKSAMLPALLERLEEIAYSVDATLVFRGDDLIALCTLPLIATESMHTSERLFELSENFARTMKRAETKPEFADDIASASRDLSDARNQEYVSFENLRAVTKEMLRMLGVREEGLSKDQS